MWQAAHYYVGAILLQQQYLEEASKAAPQDPESYMAHLMQARVFSPLMFMEHEPQIPNRHGKIKLNTQAIFTAPQKIGEETCGSITIYTFSQS